MMAVLCTKLMGAYHKRTVTGMTGVVKNLVVWKRPAACEEAEILEGWGLRARGCPMLGAVASTTLSLLVPGTNGVSGR
jgi:hypothetical protein